MITNKSLFVASSWFLFYLPILFGFCSVEGELSIGMNRYHSKDRINARERKIEMNYRNKEDRKSYVYVAN